MNSFEQSLQLLGQSLDAALHRITLPKSTGEKGEVPYVTTSIYQSLIDVQDNLRRQIEELNTRQETTNVRTLNLASDLHCIIKSIGLSEKDLLRDSADSDLSPAILNRLSKLEDINQGQPDADSNDVISRCRFQCQDLQVQVACLQSENRDLYNRLDRLEKKTKNQSNWVNSILGRRPES